MENISKFCSRKNLDCPLPPTKHENGCAPCIRKNLGLRELPNCFFNLIEGADTRSGDSFEDFAKMIIDTQEHSESHI